MSDRYDEITENLDRDQMDCVGSYADNSWTHELVDFLDDHKELERLNTHRRESHSMEWLNQLLKAAIKLRHMNDYPSPRECADTIDSLSAENSELRAAIKMWGEKFEEWNDKEIAASTRQEKT